MLSGYPLSTITSTRLKQGEEVTLKLRAGVLLLCRCRKIDDAVKQVAWSLIFPNILERWSNAAEGSHDHNTFSSAAIFSVWYEAVPFRDTDVNLTATVARSLSVKVLFFNPGCLTQGSIPLCRCLSLFALFLSFDLKRSQSPQQFVVPSTNHPSNHLPAVFRETT